MIVTNWTRMSAGAFQLRSRVNGTSLCYCFHILQREDIIGAFKYNRSCMAPTIKNPETISFGFNSGHNSSDRLH